MKEDLFGDQRHHLFRELVEAFSSIFTLALDRAADAWASVICPSPRSISQLAPEYFSVVTDLLLLASEEIVNK
jgi:hypothetical protein